MIAALVAFELALQIVAFVAWSRRDVPQPDAAGERPVALCVGDSFTYGLRAEDLANAYPAVAQRELGGAVRFVNLGWPGQDSAQVLARLPGQLKRHAPDLVYVLVGYNDFWRGGETAGAFDDGFPIRWRTGRLLSMIAAALRGGPPEGEREGAPFIGPWHAGPVFLCFEPDGTIETSDGRFDGVWSWRDAQLIVELRDGSPALQIDWRIDDDRLVLEGAAFPTPLVLARGMPRATGLDRGRAALRAGDRLLAERELTAAIAGGEQARAARLLLAQLLVEDRRPAEARATLAPAIADWAPSEPGSATAPLVDACIAAGMTETAWSIVERVLREGRVDDPFVELLVRRALHAPDRAALDAAFQHALGERELSIDHRIALLGLRVRLGVEPGAMVDSLIELALRRPDDTTFQRTVRWSDDPDLRARVEARVAELPAAERRAVLAAFDAASAGADSTGSVLGDNLRAIVTTCRRAGAEPVLMTYPGGRPDVAAVVRAVATELGTGLVDHLEAFASIERRAPGIELFVSDGHCNDAGYVRMGELVADDARSRVH